MPPPTSLPPLQATTHTNQTPPSNLVALGLVTHRMARVGSSAWWRRWCR